MYVNFNAGVDLVVTCHLPHPMHDFQGACDDLNNYSRFEWTNKTMMSAPENTACLQNMMDFPLFRGMVEEWTVSYNPLVKFLILDVNNTKRVLNLVNMKNICDSWLWTTDQDNVFVFESEDSLPNITSNFSFAKDFKILENTSQFSQEKLSTKCGDGFESNLLINNTLNTISSCIHIILYLILYLIIFLTFRFVVGIITNFILLARINRTNLMELLVLSCSQNLTNQKIFFKEPESVKNLYAIAKSCEAVYESAENQYYRK
ncbi:uncharacterized protein LOC114324359 isoform X2 [Diabrotica virgifera virgifera]|uniref:Uncharacterized protein LOC114324359 isoform X2 n=1 Tax=Diabrotica virgifera virgifera TaxID=50390 RepID=A0A6P7F383_DIAVI|nr:uncharacterized protein LOC114324359 isoform X2 [Diabrotica virgifera virgifera]